MNRNTGELGTENTVAAEDGSFFFLSESLGGNGGQKFYIFWKVLRGKMCAWFQVEREKEDRFVVSLSALVLKERCKFALSI